MLPTVLLGPLDSIALWLGPVFKLGLAALLLTLNVLQGNSLNTRVFLGYYILMSILFLVLALGNDWDVVRLFTNINDNYVFAFMAPLAFCKIRLLKKDIQIIKIYCLVILSFGLLQWIAGQPLILIEAEEKTLVSSVGFYGESRTFSFFSSPLLFGVFVSVILCFALTKLARHKNVFWSMVVVVLVLLIYTTLTRAVFAFAACLVVLTLYYLSSKRPMLWLSMVFSTTLAFSIYNVSQTRSPLTVSENQLLSRDTFEMRQDTWNQFRIQFLEFDVAKTVFGTGIYQNARFENTIPLDNTVFATLSNVGVLGALVLLASLALLLASMKPRHRIIDIFIASSLILFAFNVFVAELFLYLILFTLLISSKRLASLQARNPSQDVQADAHGLA